MHSHDYQRYDLWVFTSVSFSNMHKKAGEHFTRKRKFTCRLIETRKQLNIQYTMYAIVNNEMWFWFGLLFRCHIKCTREEERWMICGPWPQILVKLFEFTLIWKMYEWITIFLDCNLESLIKFLCITLSVQG